MLKIKNRYSKNRVSKKERILGYCINLYKKIRLKIIFLKPLKERERFHLNPFYRFMGELPSEIEEGKYFELQEITLLNLVSKVKCHQLCKGILVLNHNHPPSSSISRGIQPEKLKKQIFGYFSNTTNNCAWISLCEITPGRKELSKIANSIDIGIFNFSDDYIGITFQIKLTNEFKKTLSEAMSSEPPGKVSYSRYKCGNSKKIIQNTKSPEVSRRENVEDLVLEVKDRFHRLFLKHLPLELNYAENAPISFNEYYTNYDVKKSACNYLKSTGLFLQQT